MTVVTILDKLREIFEKEQKVKDGQIVALKDALARTTTELTDAKRRARLAESKLEQRDERIAQWKERASTYRGHMGRYQRELADYRRILRKTPA